MLIYNPMSQRSARKLDTHPAVVAYDNAPEDTSGEIAPADLDHRLTTLGNPIPHADILAKMGQPDDEE
jgi:hypothetical protein